MPKVTYEPDEVEALVKAHAQATYGNDTEVVIGRKKQIRKPKAEGAAASAANKGRKAA
jgi:hypothetical protein